MRPAADRGNRRDFCRRVASGVKALASGTIQQGPLHLWDGGGLVRPAAPVRPVAQPFQRRPPPRQGQVPRDSPVSRLFPRLPEFPPRVLPVSGGNAFLLPRPAKAQGVEGNNCEFFCCPQYRGGYPQLDAVIHCSIHTISTDHAHNKARPPPFMGWRGPRAVCRTSLASCPACPAKSPPARASHPRDLPVSRLLPRSRSFPRAVPVSDGESISTPDSGRSARGQGQ